MKKKIALLFISAIFISSALFAQPGGPGGPPEPEDPPVGIPIDGGAGILMIIGASIAMAYKKIKKNDKNINL